MLLIWIDKVKPYQLARASPPEICRWAFDAYDFSLKTPGWLGSRLIIRRLCDSGLGFAGLGIALFNNPSFEKVHRGGGGGAKFHFRIEFRFETEVEVGLWQNGTPRNGTRNFRDSELSETEMGLLAKRNSAKRKWSFRDSELSQNGTPETERKWNSILAPRKVPF